MSSNQLIDTILKEVFKNIPDQFQKVPTEKESYLSFLFFDNFNNLLDTSKDILDKVKDKKNLPSKALLNTFSIIIQKFYSPKCFSTEDDRLLPNWKGIREFKSEKSVWDKRGFSIYLTIREKIVSNPGVLEEANKRNKQYFYDHFDELFSLESWKPYFSSYRNLILLELEKEDEDNIWDYYSTITDNFLHEKELLQELTS